MYLIDLVLIHGGQTEHLFVLLRIVGQVLLGQSIFVWRYIFEVRGLGSTGDGES